MTWIKHLADILADEWGDARETYPQDRKSAKEYLMQWYGATDSEAEDAWYEYYNNQKQIDYEKSSN